MLKLSRGDGIAHLKLDRPEKLNALGPEFWEDFGSTVEELEADESLRVLILGGEGRSFCAGLDIPAMMPLLPLEPGRGPDGARQARFHRLIRQMQGAVQSLARCRLPVIAAVQGHCLGAGLDLICACDIRLASVEARFGVRETRLAMVADLGSLQYLPRIIGPGLARELIFTGRDFGAEEAKEIHLLNRVLPDPQALQEAALALAQEIVANPPLAVQGAKAVMNEAEKHQIERSLEYVATWNAAHLVTQDLGAAMSTMMTQQKPRYQGR